MRTAMVIERMQAFHEQLHGLMRESAELVAHPGSETVALAAVRWRLVRTLREYQLFKHTEVFDPIIRSGGAPRAANATELKQRCETLGAAYNDHMRRWNLGGTGPASPEYEADARRMIQLITEHLIREGAGVRLLLQGLERTRRS